MRARAFIRPFSITPLSRKQNLAEIPSWFSEGNNHVFTKRVSDNIGRFRDHRHIDRVSSVHSIKFAHSYLTNPFLVVGTRTTFIPLRATAIKSSW